MNIQHIIKDCSLYKLKIMRTYRYLKATVTKPNGTTSLRNLKLSDAYMLSRMAQDNQKVVIRSACCNPHQYKKIFG